MPRVSKQVDNSVEKSVRLARDRHKRDLSACLPERGRSQSGNAQAGLKSGLSACVYAQADKSRGLWFGADVADHAVAVSNSFRHSMGKWAGQTFNLQPWQEHDIVRPLFGWKRANGTRC